MVKKGNIPWNKGKKGVQVAWNKGINYQNSASFKKGHSVSESTRQKIGAKSRGRIPWNKGKKCPQLSEALIGRIVTDETKKKQSDEKLKNPIRYWEGKHLSEDHKKKLREANKGKTSAMKGKHFSEESKRKLSEACKGRIPWNKGKAACFSEDSLLKMSKALKGRILSEEHKEKISKASKGKPKTEEFKKKISGENSCFWKGGISFIPYCPKFNRALKERIRERDNQTCQLCGKLEKHNDKKLLVHHVHYDKENCYPDLISLCISCNSKVNFNRDYYEAFFMNKLNDRGLLFWIYRC